MKLRFTRSIPLLLSTVLLAGCASSEQLVQRNNERCASRGLQLGTEAFSNCVAELETEGELRRSARHRDMVERSAAPSFRP
jgi:uncharacterized lipoprotein YajG